MVFYERLTIGALFLREGGWVWDEADMIYGYVDMYIKVRRAGSEGKA